MFTRFLRLFRQFSPLLLVVAFITLLTQQTTGQPYALPGPATTPEPATHMLLINFPESDGGGQCRCSALPSGQ